MEIDNDSYNRQQRKIRLMREIVDGHDDMNKAAKELSKRGFVTSLAEGRRVYMQMKGDEK